jgi:uncharacterized protein (TIGR00661 family)
VAPRILIAPLDWGLGHTTRCLPIIRVFLELGADVTIAGNEKQVHLLCKEIPELKWIFLKGYGMRYSTSSWRTRAKIIIQIPKILTVVKREHRWLEQLLKNEKFDLVISDNRFGLYHDQVHAIFITHQLQIQVPFSKWLEKILQRWNYHFINKFDECWVPDYKEDRNLAGDLSHSLKIPSIKLEYIGPLSRFKSIASHSIQEELLLVLISGPEPQRTIFENIMVEQLKSFSGRAIVLRGLPGSDENLESFGNVSFINHLPTDEMSRLMQEASLVICRSGYSSIMDLVRLQKKSILIPTPGQTEQEYLASYLMKEKFFFALDQKSFSLNKALAAASTFQFADMRVFNQINLSSIVRDLLKRMEVKTPQVNGSNQ